MSSCDFQARNPLFFCRISGRFGSVNAEIASDCDCTVFGALRRQVTKVLSGTRRDQENASLALTTATQVTDDVTSLAERVAALLVEKGRRSPPKHLVELLSKHLVRKPTWTEECMPQPSQWSKPGRTSRRYDHHGGFPKWTRTEILHSFVETQILPALKPEMRAALDATSMRLPTPRDTYYFHQK